MSRRTGPRTFVMFLALGFASQCLLAHAAPPQPTSRYEAMIWRGKAELQAGHADAALAIGEQAIKLDARNWEGYALAGGAQMNLKRYEDAADDFTKALKLAPADKQPALSNLRRQCLLAAAGVEEPAPAAAAPPAASPAPAPKVTQAEVVLWETIKNSTYPADFESYLQQYPHGAFAVLAERNLAAAKERADEAQRALAQKEDAQQQAILQEAIHSGAKPAEFQSQQAIGFDAELFCRQALLYGQVDVCAAGTIFVSDKNVGFQTDKGEIRFLSPRSATNIKAEGGRDGDTFSIYDDHGNRYRFGPQKFDSPYVTFLQTSLSDFNAAYKELSSEHSEKGEEALWDSIKDSSDPAGFESYLAQYPSGKFAALAKSRLAGDDAAVWKDAGTGLWWTRSDSGTNITIDQALAYCSHLQLLGRTDWRVPTLDELKKVHNGFTHHINSEFQLSDGTGYLLSSTHSGAKYRIYQEELKRGSDGVRTLCVRNAQ